MTTVLSPRKEQVLRAVVEGHVASSQPVGSGQVLAGAGLDCSSATVRNEMAELMEAGYIEQPHTSAGRVPTDKGYRHYVDRLMSVPESNQRVRAAINRRLRRFEGWMEAVCEETCRLLLTATGQLAIVVASSAGEAHVRDAHVSQVASRTFVLIVTLSTGQVLHHSLAAKAALSARELARCSRLLNAALAGRPLNQASAALAGLAKDTARTEQEREVLRLLAGISHVPETVEQVFSDGASRIAETPEFRDSGGLTALLSLLDERRRLGRTVLAASGGREFAVSIGRENPAQEMSRCSLVLRSVSIQQEPPARATLAVLGPTRMDYPRVAGALRDFASELPRWLHGL